MGNNAALVATGWTIEAPGWWIHPTRGGICREVDGKWWAYPLKCKTKKIGPFKTATLASKAPLT